MFVRGALGKAGRKRARRAQTFLGGQGGFLTASTVMAAVGVAWGLFDHLRAQQTAAAGGSTPAGASGTWTPSGGPAPHHRWSCQTPWPAWYALPRRPPMPTAR